MQITIPAHVKETLATSQTLPENQPLQVLQTSNENIYLWFSEVQVGYLVTNNEWLKLTMAEASSYDILKSFAYTHLNLELINIYDLKIYKDWSMSWTYKKEQQTCNKDSIISKITEWKNILLKNSFSIKYKLFFQAKNMKKTADMLEILELKLRKTLNQ